MTISGKVTLDLNRRNVSWARLAWNKLTPTRWSKTVSGSIADLAANGPVAITAHENHLSTKFGEREVPIFRSHAYAAALFNAGVTGLEVGKGVGLENVKAILNSLSDSSTSAVLKHELISPISLADALLKLIPGSKKVIDDPQQGHWVRGRRSRETEVPMSIYPPYPYGGGRSYEPGTPDYYVVDKPEISHLEFSLKDIEKAWAFLQDRSSQFQIAVIDHLTKKDTKLAILLRLFSQLRSQLSG